MLRFFWAAWPFRALLTLLARAQVLAAALPGAVQVQPPFSKAQLLQATQWQLAHPKHPLPS